MIVGYYILKKDAHHEFCSQESTHSCSTELVDGHVIIWARFHDHGHEKRFIDKTGAEPLPDPRRLTKISLRHAFLLAQHGIKEEHTTMDVSDCLEKSVGIGMRLPQF